MNLDKFGSINRSNYHNTSTLSEEVNNFFKLKSCDAFLLSTFMDLWFVPEFQTRWIVSKLSTSILERRLRKPSHISNLNSRIQRQKVCLFTFILTKCCLKIDLKFIAYRLHNRQLLSTNSVPILANALRPVLWVCSLFTKILFKLWQSIRV